VEAQTLLRISSALGEVDNSRVADTVKGIELKPKDSDILLARKVPFKVIFKFGFDIFLGSTVFKRGELLDFAVDTTDKVFKTKTLLAVCVTSWKFSTGAEDGAVVGCIARYCRRRLAA
jgi:hypothetical protein